MAKNSCGLILDMKEGPEGSYVVSNVIEEGQSRVILEGERGTREILEDLFKPYDDPQALIPYRGGSWSSFTTALVKETLATLALRYRIRLVQLRSNVDLFSFINLNINGRLTEVSYRIGRMAPADVRTFIARRIMTREQRQVILSKALDDAADIFFRGRLVKIDTGRAKQALGHTVTTDAKGLALDFNPTDEILEITARKELLEELPDYQIVDDVVRSRMTQIKEQMNQHLFGGSPRTSTASIPLTGSRYQDELVTVRMLIENNGGLFMGLRRNANDADISRVIAQLKDEDYVFHHSGKVHLNPDGYPVAEMQLIDTAAHSQMIKAYNVEQIHLNDLVSWVAARGEETRLATTVEQFLQHVGACKVYSLYYGIGKYK